MKIQDEQILDKLESDKEEIENVENAIRTLIDSVNTCSPGVVELGIARQLLRSHRTLQQSFINHIFHGIQGYLEWIKEKGYVDLRNQASVNMSDDLKQFLEDHPFPLI